MESGSRQTVKVFFFIACLLVASLHGYAQFFQMAQDSRVSAMGGGILALPNDQHNRIEIDYCHTFSLSQMATKSILLHYNHRPNHWFDAHYSHFGDLDYSEQQASLLYGLACNSHLRVAAKIIYSHLGSADPYYDPENWLSADLHLHAIFSEKNALQLLIGYAPWLKQRVIYGVARYTYSPISHVLSSLEISYYQQIRLHFGLQYTYHKNYFLRTGFATNPLLLTFGVGTQQKQLSINLSLVYHQVLGITPDISLALWF